MNHPRIEKTIVLKATLARVWAAISDPVRYGEWFGATFDGAFVEGQWLSGRIAPTRVDPEVAKLQQPHAGKPLRIFVEAIEPMKRFAFRWHPYAIEPGRDYSSEPTTLVTFELRETAGGIELTITETGFEQLSAERREQALQSNDGGWTHQCRLISAYLALQA